MVRKFRRITIILLVFLLLFWTNFAWSDINEDMMSEIMSGKPIESADATTEISTITQPLPEITNSKQAVTNIIKEQLPLTAQDQAIISYNKGLEAVTSNQEIEAVTLFKKALIEYPKHHKSRMQLISIYQKIGWNDEVEKLLQAGLDLDPEHADFIKNLALLYQQKGQMRKALSILLSMPDNQAAQPDYLALLALAYLNADQPGMAEKHYHKLITVNKENCIWWLGLAVAQDANGNYRKAIDSFNQAKTLGRFNTETLDYINNKMEEIKQYE